MSRHPLYTLSGMASRTASFLAVHWSEAPNDLFPAAVFAYGIIEIFGLRKSIKLVNKIRRKNAGTTSKKNGNLPRM